MSLILSILSVNIWLTIDLLASKLTVMFCKDQIESNYKYHSTEIVETKEDKQYSITHISLKQGENTILIPPSMINIFNWLITFTYPATTPSLRESTSTMRDQNTNFLDA